MIIFKKKGPSSISAEGILEYAIMLLLSVYLLPFHYQRLALFSRSIFQPLYILTYNIDLQLLTIRHHKPYINQSKTPQRTFTFKTLFSFFIKRRFHYYKRDILGDAYKIDNAVGNVNRWSDTCENCIPSQIYTRRRKQISKNTCHFNRK